MTKRPRARVGSLLVMAALGCAGAEERANVCGLASQEGPPPPRATTCEGAEHAYDARRGCPIDPAGTEQIYFKNTVREWTQTVSLQVLVDGEEVFASTDPILLEHDTFPIATLPRRDYDVTTVITTWGRGGPLCEYRHELRSGVHHRKAGDGPLTLVFYSMKDRPLEESFNVRWEEPAASKTAR